MYYNQLFTVKIDNALQCIEPEPRATTVDVLEESWYVTPPSCFNAKQDDCLTLPPSPLENLLIEHPSMSVYDGPADIWLAVERSETSEETPENPSTHPSAENRVQLRVVRAMDKAKKLARNGQENVLQQRKKQFRKSKLRNHNQMHISVPRSRRKQKKIDRKQGKYSSVYSHRGC